MAEGPELLLSTDEVAAAAEDVVLDMLWTRQERAEVEGIRKRGGFNRRAEGDELDGGDGLDSRRSEWREVNEETRAIPIWSFDASKSDPSRRAATERARSCHDPLRAKAAPDTGCSLPRRSSSNEFLLVPPTAAPSMTSTGPQSVALAQTGELAEGGPAQEFAQPIEDVARLEGEGGGQRDALGDLGRPARAGAEERTRLTVEERHYLNKALVWYVSPLSTKLRTCRA